MIALRTLVGRRLAFQALSKDSCSFWLSIAMGFRGSRMNPFLSFIEHGVVKGNYKGYLFPIPKHLLVQLRMIKTLFIQDDTVNGTIEDIAQRVPSTGSLIKNYPRSRQKTACKIVVELLKDDGLTIERIVDIPRVSRRIVARYIKEFQEKVVLKREGNNRNGKWILSQF